MASHTSPGDGRWTVRQAGYRLHSTVATTSQGGLPQHFVATRHGIVVRTWLGPDFTEVALRRPGHTGSTYQGTVRSIPGGWQAFDDRGNPAPPLGVVHRDYLDAEAVLLPRRTGHRSAVRYQWPAGLLREVTAHRTAA